MKNIRKIQCVFDNIFLPEENNFKAVGFKSATYNAEFAISF